MKSNNSKYLIIGGTVFLLTGAAAYSFIKKRKDAKALMNEQESIKQSSSDPLVVNNTSTNKSSIVGFPLKSGSKGTDVILWQSYLHASLGEAFPKKNIIGIFGPATEAATFKLTGKKTVSKIMFDAFRKKNKTQTSKDIFSIENAKNWLTALNPFAAK